MLLLLLFCFCFSLCFILFYSLQILNQFTLSPTNYPEPVFEKDSFLSHLYASQNQCFLFLHFFCVFHLFAPCYIMVWEYVWFSPADTGAYSKSFIFCQFFSEIPILGYFGKVARMGQRPDNRRDEHPQMTGTFVWVFITLYKTSFPHCLLVSSHMNF